MAKPYKITERFFKRCPKCESISIDYIDVFKYRCKICGHEFLDIETNIHVEIDPQSDSLLARGSFTVEGSGTKLVIRPSNC